MRFIFEKDRCKIEESINGLALVIEPKSDKIDFTGAEGNEYTLYDEIDEPCPPFPAGAFVQGKTAPIILIENVVEEILSIAGELRETYPEMATAELSEMILDRMTEKKK